MNATRRVARTQSQLRVVVVLSALLWGTTALIATLIAELLAGRWMQGTAARQRGWDWNVALMVAVVTFSLVLWRARFVLSARRVALWIEERAPSLQYALVTASDPSVTDDTGMLEAAIQRSNMDTLIRPAVLTPAIYAMVALSVTAGLFAIAITAESARSVASAVRLTRGNAAPIPLGNRLTGIAAVVTDPAYAGGRSRTLEDPSGITALVGSRIMLRGPGPSSGVGARLTSGALQVGGRTTHWEAMFTMPTNATVVTLTDRGHDRVIAVIPVVDQPPVVTMLQPSRDTVWRRVPGGSLAFVARATDDIGLSNGRFEYTVTTGSGEIFKSSTSSVGAMRFSNARSGELHASLGLAQLGLTEGAILSVRAEVSDGNTVTGPSLSTSDTRTFRVARADEYDSLAVDAAPPPPVEKSLLTERMLIISAESLATKRPTLAAPSYVASAGRIGTDQADLRKKVYGILYEQDEAGAKGGTEGDDEELDPQLVLNRDLKVAYDAMWDAERSLNIGEISIALPFMTRAAAALERARLANRLYLRGRPPRIVVNVEKVRLTAKEKGLSNMVASPRSRADSAVARLNASFDRAIGIAGSDPRQFADALIRLRAASASVNSAFAAAIGEAVDALRAGKDMTPSLVRARRALLGAPRVGNPSIPWSGSWSGNR
ncbi:MAG: hypothetical protein M3R65_02860 [Gemmatimonadota bacterium]|nr:hypothetical protein [Gemmatimonadota bacterium]